jgi:hypothetical protein
VEEESKNPFFIGVSCGKDGIELTCSNDLFGTWGQTLNENQANDLIKMLAAAVVRKEFHASCHKNDLSEAHQSVPS